jgi:hypothetical protein
LHEVVVSAHYFAVVAAGAAAVVYAAADAVAAGVVADIAAVVVCSAALVVCHPELRPNDPLNLGGGLFVGAAPPQQIAVLVAQENGLA